MIGPLKGSPKRLSYGVFPSDKRSWMLRPIWFRSVWCRRSMIPGKIFTSFAELHGIFSVNDFRLPIRLQELLQAPLCSLRSCCFAWIRLDPLGGHFLHRDCISMIVFEIHNLHWELWHGALVILVLWQISQCRSFGKWVQILCLPKSALLAGSKDNPWEELACGSCAFRNSVIHKIHSEFLQRQQLFWSFRRVRVSTFLPFHTFTWHNCGMVIYPARVSPFLSKHTLAWPSWRCHGWWGRRAWGRLGMINFLHWRCHGCWRRQAWGRTRW